MQQRSKSGGVLGGILFIVLGILLMTHGLNLGEIIRFALDYWPLLLVMWGIWMVYRGMSEPKKVQDFTEQEEKIVTPDFIGQIKQSITFGDVLLKLEGSSFHGGEASAVFGSIKVYATNLLLSPEEHKLFLVTTLGNIRVDLPPDLPVKVTAQVSLGDIKVFEKRQSGFGQQLSFQTPNYEGAVSKLHLDCKVGLGDIKIF